MYSCPPDNKQKLQNSWEDCVRSSFMTRMERYNAEKSDVSLRHNQFWNEESWHSPHLFHAECWIASRSDFLFRSSCRGSKNGRKQEGVRSQEEETREPRSIPFQMFWELPHHPSLFTTFMLQVFVLIMCRSYTSVTAHRFAVTWHGPPMSGPWSETTNHISCDTTVFFCAQKEKRDGNKQRPSLISFIRTNTFPSV